MGTRQSESLRSSAAIGAGVGGDHGVRNGFSFDDSEIVLTCGESFSSGMIDAGRCESDLDVHHQQVLDRLRQESQLQLRQLQQKRPLPLNSLFNLHCQADERHNPRRSLPRAGFLRLSGEGSWPAIRAAAAARPASYGSASGFRQGLTRPRQ